MENQQQIRPCNFRTISVTLLCAIIPLIGLSAAVARADSGVHAPGTERFDQQMEPILKSYLQIGSALSTDSLDEVAKNAKAIVEQAGSLDSDSVSGEHAAHYKNVPTNIKKAAEALSQAKTLEEARESFKKLSMPMAMWATMSKPKTIDVLYCSMAKASWVQKRGKVRNPYYGPKMLDCGEVVGGDADDSHDDHKH